MSKKPKRGKVAGRMWSKEPNWWACCRCRVGGAAGDHSQCSSGELPSDFDEAQRGAREGRAWAENGRSIAAVESVFYYYMREDPEGLDDDAMTAHYEKLELAMLEAIGEDDEEFYADGGPHDQLNAWDENMPYLVGWLDAVSNYFAEEMQEAA